MKFKVITGIFEGTIFEGVKKQNRIINLNSIGQSFPVENCQIFEAYHGEIIGNKYIISKIESNNTFVYCCRLLNKKGNPIKGGKGAGGMFFAHEFDIKENIKTILK